MIWVANDVLALFRIRLRAERIYRSGPRCGTFVTAFLATVLTASVSAKGEEMSRPEFLAKLTEAKKRSEKLYSHVMIKAKVHHEEPLQKDDRKKDVIYTIKYEVLGQQIKAEVDYERGGPSATRTLVASPDLSFSTVKSRAGDTPMLEYLSPRQNEGYNGVGDMIRQLAPHIRGPNIYVGGPLLDMLNWKTTEIRSIEPLESDGRSIIRLTIRRNKEKKLTAHDFMDVVLDLDPALDFALLKAVTRAMKGSEVVFTQNYEATFSKSGAVPVVKTAQFTQEKNPGQPGVRELVEVLSVDFSPKISPRDFSLVASGITEVPRGPGGGFPLSFYISTAIAVLSLIALIALRSRQWAKKATD